MYLISIDWKCDLLNEFETVSMIYFSEKYLFNINLIIHWFEMLKYFESIIRMYYQILKDL